MKVVALISGGKDSCYSMMECVRHGHEIVALANLRPPQQGNQLDHNEEPLVPEQEELDSFMFQTIGVSAICPAIAECMDLPLVSHQLHGKSVQKDLDYRSAIDGDEVEDLFALLQEVKERFPEVNAVCSGAILSTYQRNRVEFVCSRLGLTSLAFLWQREQHEVLTSMIDDELEAVLVKIASMGLKPRMLGRRLGDLLGEFEDLHEQFEFHVCGEGGEYETVTLDCPLFKRRIVLDKTEVIVDDDCSFAPAAHLRIDAVHTEPKDTDECGQAFYMSKFQEKKLLSNKGITVTSNDVQSSDPRGQIIDQGDEPVVSQSTDLGLVAVQNCVGNPEGTLEDELREAMSKLETVLAKHNLNLGEHVCFVHLYLASMKDFGKINAEYCKFFEAFPAPSRACVEVDLALGHRVMVAAQATRHTRDVLHVRSISHWAPVCIGPYSQANKIVDMGGYTFVAGQIPLEPTTMEMMQGSLTEQLDKSLKHCSAVLQCKGASLEMVRSVVVYVSSAAPFDSESVFARLPIKATKVLIQIPHLPRDALVEVEVCASQGQSVIHQDFSKLRKVIEDRYIIEVLHIDHDHEVHMAPAAVQLNVYDTASEKPCNTDNIETLGQLVLEEIVKHTCLVAGHAFYVTHDPTSVSLAMSLCQGTTSLSVIPCSKIAVPETLQDISTQGNSPRCCLSVLAWDFEACTKTEGHNDDA